MKQFVKNHLKRFPDLYYFIYRINRSIKNYSIKSGYLKNIEKEMEKLILPNPRYIKKTVPQSSLYYCTPSEYEKEHLLITNKF